MNEIMNNQLYIPYNSVLFTDLSLLRSNVRSILDSLPTGIRLIPVLKDDAYGLGLERIASVLCEFPEIKTFAVADVSEGILLRQLTCSHEILVMSSVLPFQAESVVHWSLTASAGRLGLVSLLSKEAEKQGKKVKIHIAVDTGLHRTGVEPGAPLQTLLDEILAAGSTVIVSGCFSHIYDGDCAEVCEQSFRLFSDAVSQIEAAGICPGTRHLLASSSYEGHPEYAMDAVRIGRRLYMDHPTRPDGGVCEISSWRCYISSISTRKAGDKVGYGGKVIIRKDSKLATLSVGYGDGLNCELGKTHAPVLVSGKRCPLLFTMMDQSVADVTGTDCHVGDEVTVFGYDGKGNCLPSQEIALMIGDNEGCGLTSALSSRVHRAYIQ